jgi:hypothetical protein
MATPFDSIPTRAYTTVQPGWWNIIKTTLQSFFNAYFGGGAVAETEVAIANSQTNANITGLSFSGSSYRTAHVKFDIKRGTGASEKRARIFATAVYRNGSWELWDPDYQGDDDIGITFTITVAGQFQYTSDALATGTMKFKAETFNV